MIDGTIAMRAAVAATAALLLAAPAASAAESFFAGKTEVIIAGYRPGGGIDGMARLIARHLGQFIPGKPEILVKNIAGAAGNVAANHLYSKADKDGLTLGVPGRTWMLSKLFGDPGVRFDAKKFTYIGSAGPVNNKLWVRSDLGIKTFEDLKNFKRKLIFGALALRATNGSIPLILGHDGLPITVLPGYKGTSSVMLAIEQKEVDGMLTGDDTFRANRGDLIDDKVVIPILQSTPEVKGVPLIEDIVSPKSKALYQLAAATERFGVPLIGPPGIPADRAATLRKAFVDMSRDKSFIADAKKVSLPVGEAIEGEALKKMVADTIDHATPEVVKQFNDYTASPGARGGKGKKR